MRNVGKVKQVWLMGGLGNNLFQYLLYLRLKKDFEETYLNRRLIQKNILTSLLGWTIHEPLILALTPKTIYRTNHFLRDSFHLIVFMLKLANKFNEPPIYKKYISSKVFSKKVNFFGYYQNKKFIEESLNELNELRELINNQLNTNIHEFDFVIHFRWGDSVWAKKNKNYYEYIRNHISSTKSKVTIVTDDQEVAQEFFKDLNVTIISSNNAMDDFKIMLSCRKLACAPSTFSWWASQLNLHCEEITLPKKIFKDLGNHRNIRCNVI